jgi:hypothetical protein
MVLYCLLILVLAMAVVGASGMKIGGRRKDASALAKKKRMPFIAAKGLLVLVSAAFYLSAKANAGAIDSTSYTAQGIELVAGAMNLVLTELSIRDGAAMGKRRPQSLKR